MDAKDCPESTCHHWEVRFSCPSLVEPFSHVRPSKPSKESPSAGVGSPSASWIERFLINCYKFHTFPSSIWVKLIIDKIEAGSDSFLGKNWNKYIRNRKSNQPSHAWNVHVHRKTLQAVSLSPSRPPNTPSHRRRHFAWCRFGTHGVMCMGYRNHFFSVVCKRCFGLQWVSPIPVHLILAPLILFLTSRKQSGPLRRINTHPILDRRSIQWIED